MRGRPSLFPHLPRFLLAPGAALILCEWYDAKEASRSIWSCTLTTISVDLISLGLTPDNWARPPQWALHTLPVGGKQERCSSCFLKAKCHRLTTRQLSSPPALQGQHAVVTTSWAVLPKSVVWEQRCKIQPAACWFAYLLIFTGSLIPFIVSYGAHVVTLAGECLASVLLRGSHKPSLPQH